MNRPDAGQFAAAGTEPGEGLFEFRVEDAAHLEGWTPQVRRYYS